MRISLGDLNYYRDTLAQIGEDASHYVRDAIEGLGSGAGVTDMRVAAIEAITDTIGIHGDRAQALAGQLFDEVCAAEGMGPFDFELADDIIDFGMLEEKVRWFAGKLVETDGGDRFLDDCSTLADFYVRRCNYESMIRNCYRNNVRYARVPTGVDTCDFCMMLASRGFVYYDEVSAMEGSHAHCDCVCVPGNGADALSPTQIEGYDPSLLYDIWQGQINDKAHKRASKNGTSEQVERVKIMDSYSTASRRAKARRRLR